MSYGLCIFLLVVGLAFIGLGQGVQSIPVTEMRRRLSGILANLPANGRIAFTANTASSTALASVSSFSGLQLGMTVTGAGIPAGTTIVAMASGADTITLSQAATATATGVALTAFWATSAAEVHLYAAAYAGGDDPVPGDFTEATFDTYAALSLGMAIGPYTNPDGSAEADFGDLSWVLVANPTVGNAQIFGYWVDYIPPGGSTRVVALWENFPSQLPMTEAGNAVVCSIPFTLPDAGTVTLP